MKKNNSRCCVFALFLIVNSIVSCIGQSGTRDGSNKNGAPKTAAVAAHPIDEYVVEVFEDSKGNLWFGTLSKGAARFDGKTLTYFSEKDGLCGNSVVSIAEDRAGNLWLGTQSGLSKFDGKTFTNFTKKEGLCDDRVSNVLVDRAGIVWVGTWGGVCRYDGRTFTAFEVPIPDVELPPYHATEYWVTEIMEDRQGNIWVGRDGYGACCYAPASGQFTHFTKKDGLASNNVQVIREDRQGNIWFGSRIGENDHPDPASRKGDGGLNRYDGHRITHYPDVVGLNKNETYAIEEDRAGNLWIGANGLGVYRYDGTSFHLYRGTDRMDLTWSMGVQAILADKNGAIWFGFSGGLFRLGESGVVHVGEEGPWK
jgi:ligand-binding sensor domain-containing protein